MNTIFHHSALVEAAKHMERLEGILGATWLGAEWVDRKRKLNALITECAQSGNMIIRLDGLNQHKVNDFF